MNKEKSIDESWKESAKAVDESRKESAEAAKQPIDQDGAGSEAQKGGEEQFEVSFLNYVTSLTFQALIFLGEVPNPMTNEPEKNLPQAKVLIDTLAMLKDKTKGNLSEQEQNMLNASVYELQMKYVDVLTAENQQGNASSGG